MQSEAGAGLQGGPLQLSVQQYDSLDAALGIVLQLKPGVHGEWVSMADCPALWMPGALCREMTPCTNFSATGGVQVLIQLRPDFGDGLDASTPLAYFHVLRFMSAFAGCRFL